MNIRSAFEDVDSRDLIGAGLWILFYFIALEIGLRFNIWTVESLAIPDPSVGFYGYEWGFLVGWMFGCVTIMVIWTAHQARSSFTQDAEQRTSGGDQA